jgi:pyruvate dehydrogenase E1 component alpha subunit/2-oxoisovalerate dehydrogenase E1 component alpha subunit
VPEPAAAPSPSPSAAEAYFAGDELARATGLLQLLRPDGTLVDEASVPAALDRALALRIHRGMLLIRIMDERLLALQRQGRIGFYGEARGQEAAIVGSAAALTAGDWIVPALREAGAGLYAGMPLRQYVAQLFGNANDAGKGRQLPCHPCDRGAHYVVMSSCIATQAPHAVGIAMAMRIAGDHGRVAIGYLGDGATSEADFHVAANFAGVFRPPLVLFCQNNQWAISTPGSAQTASATIALKGLAYGLESYRVDGNDALAVYAATARAVARARAGAGPTFIEALTYRIGAHSSSDDPSRYRDESITLEWKTGRDPLTRFAAFLRARGWLDAAAEAALAEEVEAEVRAAIAAEEAAPPPPLESLVEDVYEELPWHLREQLRDLRKD